MESRRLVLFPVFYVPHVEHRPLEVPVGVLTDYKNYYTIIMIIKQLILLQQFNNVDAL